MKNIIEQPSLAVATTQPQAVAVAPQQGISIEAAFNAAASKALDKDSLAGMQQLLAMDGERKFNTAFVALMSAIPPIVGYRAIPDRAGNTKFEYANFEDIDAIVRPICQRHGFCYSFKETGYESGRVTTTMMLTHAYEPRSYRIILPPDYATSGKRYPVIYYFHGHSDRYALEKYDAGVGTVPKIAGSVAAH